MRNGPVAVRNRPLAGIAGGAPFLTGRVHRNGDLVDFPDQQSGIAASRASTAIASGCEWGYRGLVKPRYYLTSFSNGRRR